MRNIESSKSKPFLYFSEFFLKRGLEEFKEDFINRCCVEKKNHPNQVVLFDLEDDFIMHRQISFEDGGTDDLKDSLTETIEKQLEYQVSISKELIDQAVSDYLDKYNDADKFLRFQERKLQELILSTDDIFVKYPFYKTILENLLVHIRKSFSGSLTAPIRNEVRSITPNQNTNIGDDENIEYSYFLGNSSTTGKTLKNIYSALCENAIIQELDDSYKGESQFLAIFGSSKPQDLDFKIQFTVNNVEICRVIESLIPYIKNLNPTSIELSKCFYNKKGKLLTSNDLNVAKGKAKMSKRISPDVMSFLKRIKNTI